MILQNNITEGLPPFNFSIYDDQDNLIHISGPTSDSIYFFENLKGGATYRIVTSDARVCFGENIITTFEQPEFQIELGYDINLMPGDLYTFNPQLSIFPLQSHGPLLMGFHVLIV